MNTAYFDVLSRLDSHLIQIHIDPLDLPAAETYYRSLDLPEVALRSLGMTQALKTAIDEVNHVIEAKLKEVSELKRSVNALCRQADLAPQYKEEADVQDGGRVALHRDSYYGRPLATAMREHLEAQRHAVTIPELLTALEQGGFDFEAINWTPENRLRNVAISLSKNPLFKRLPSGVVGLKVWYDDSPKESGQRSTKKRTASAKKKHAARRATKSARQSPKAAKKQKASSVKEQSNDLKKATRKAEKGPASGQAHDEPIH